MKQLSDGVKIKGGAEEDIKELGALAAQLLKAQQNSAQFEEADKGVPTSRSPPLHFKPWHYPFLPQCVLPK